MIKVQKQIKFINDCNAIVDYNELEKTVIWYAKSPVISAKHIYMHGKYPAISIHMRAKLEELRNTQEDGERKDIV